MPNNSTVAMPYRELEVGACVIMWMRFFINEENELQRLGLGLGVCVGF
jgi:hypothetical protein